MNPDTNISPETFEQIERYLLQQMTDAEKTTFESALAANAELQDQVRQVQLVMIGVKESLLSNRLNGFHPSTAMAAIPAASTRTVSIQRWLVAASILILISLGGWWMYQRAHQHEKLYANYYQPDPGLITAMSSTDNYVFDKAMVDYKTGNYSTALTAWKGLLANNSASDTLNYFIGSALLADHQPKEAIPYLQKVTMVTESEFTKDAYWYLGLALLKENKWKEATNFILLSNHPQKEALLQQLKNSNR